MTRCSFCGRSGQRTACGPTLLQKNASELEAVHTDPEEILTVVAGEKARLMYENGGLDEGIISCGQGIGLVHDIPTVKELFERIIGEASKIVKGFQEQAGKLG